MANNQLQFTHLPIHSFTHELFDNFYKIMQNKANFQKAKMNINKVLTKGYENKWLHRRRENKPNQTQFQYQYAQNKANRTQFLYQYAQNKAKTKPISDGKFQKIQVCKVAVMSDKIKQTVYQVF